MLAAAVGEHGDEEDHGNQGERQNDELGPRHMPSDHKNIWPGVSKMSFQTRTQADLRYIRSGVGGTVTGLLLVPTAANDDAVSPPGAVVNRQYIRDNVPTLAVTDTIYARLDGATMTGPLRLSGFMPEDERTAIDKGYFDAALALMVPTLTQLTPIDGQIVWAPEHYGVYQITMDQDATLHVAGHTPGATYRLLVSQPDPQLVPQKELTFSAEFAWPSGMPPTLTSTPGAIDVFTFVSNGTRLLGIGQTDYF